MNQRALAILLIPVLALAAAASLSAQALGREVTVSALDNEKFLPSVAYNVDRGEYLVVWHNDWGGLRDIYGARLDRFGRVLSTFTVASGANDRAQPAAAYDLLHDRYLVVWIYDYNGNGSDWDLRGRLVPWNGPSAALTEFTIYDATDSQWNPKVAYSTVDDEFLVVWTNTSAAPASVSLRLVGSDGVPGYATTLAGDGVHNYLNPDLVYSQFRNEYLVAYEVNQVDVAVRRVYSPGNFTSEVMVANWPDAESSPAVAACPGQNQWLVAWQNSDPDIYVRFLNGDSSVDGGPVEIIVAPGIDRTPAVACLPGGAQYLVPWEYEYAGGLFGIRGQRIGINKGLIGGAMPIRPVYGGQTRNAKSPAVVGGFLGWSVAWVQERDGSAYSDLHAKMVWALFADDFETGNAGMWSAVVP